MSYLEPSTSLQSTEQCESQWRRYAFCCHAHQFVVTWPTGNSPHTAPIDILDDDSLLNIFYLYRPFLLDEDKDDSDEARLMEGDVEWGREYWWFKLSHVCRRWRNLILASSSYLGLCLVCTKGTPVADMLAHSLSLPLVIDYSFEDPNINTEAEEGLILALGQRDRVRCIRLRMDTPNQQTLIMAINEEYPILKYLVIVTPDTDQGLALPETLQAPHLHHLVLLGFALPIGSRLLTTAVDLVTLVLVMTIPSTYFQPNALLRWISFMPQLETLVIHFDFAVPGSAIERQLTHIPTITPITLPNLRWFWFLGVSAFLEAIVCRMSTPRLERFQVILEHFTFSVPHLLQFMNTTENLRFSTALLSFSSDQVDVAMLPYEDADFSQSLHIRVVSCHLDWQVSAVTQICNSLSQQIFSAVEHLTLQNEVHSQSSEEHDEVNPIEWRKILRSFRNVKTLRVEEELEEKIARCLRLEDGVLPLGLLPELNELKYSRNSDSDNEFASFINARRNADRPITVVDL
jgi:hypothetical protein